MAKKKTNTNTKTKRRSFRQRRAAIIIASVLALGMILSVLLIYADFMFGDRSGQPGDDLEQLRRQYEQHREYYEQQVENLKEALDITDRPSPAILRDMVAYYTNLVQIQLFLQYFEDETDLLEEYRNELVDTYRVLVKREPYDLDLHSEFLHIYYYLVDDPEGALAIALPLRELFRENPQTGSHMEMILIMKHLEQDEFVDEESAWLREYLEGILDAGEMENLDRYYYALLLSDILDEPELAREHFGVVLDTEEEDSDLYNAVRIRLENMDADNEDD